MWTREVLENGMHSLIDNCGGAQKTRMPIKMRRVKILLMRFQMRRNSYWRLDKRLILLPTGK
jgi:hypothetical protein